MNLLTIFKKETTMNIDLRKLLEFNDSLIKETNKALLKMGETINDPAMDEKSLKAAVAAYNDLILLRKSVNQTIVLIKTLMDFEGTENSKILSELKNEIRKVEDIYSPLLASGN